MMRGPGRHWPRGQCIGRGHPGKGNGAPACHVSIEGEEPERALPVFRELVGSETVQGPGVSLFENRQRVDPAKGATRPSHETVQGHEGKLGGIIPLQEGNVGVGSRLGDRIGEPDRDGKGG